VARSFPESKTCKLFVACSGICLTCSQQSSCPCHAPDPHHHTHPLPLPTARVSIYLPQYRGRGPGSRALRRGAHDPGRRSTKYIGTVTDRWTPSNG